MRQVIAMIEKLVIIASHGTLDALNDMVLLATGAVTFDIPVDIFLMHDAVYVAAKKNADMPLKVSTGYPEVEEAYKNGLKDGKIQVWHELLSDIKEMGDVRVTACGLATELFGLTEDDFLDDVAGVADFVSNREPDDIVITL